MTERSQAHCRRCARSVKVVGVWRGAQWAKRAWYGGLVVLCVLAPVIMSEITLLLPLAIMFAAAAGPIHGLAAQKPTCEECGAEIEESPKA
jgi:hypothetical protein